MWWTLFEFQFYSILEEGLIGFFVLFWCFLFACLLACFLFYVVSFILVFRRMTILLGWHLVIQNFIGIFKELGITFCSFLLFYRDCWDNFWSFLVYLDKLDKNLYYNLWLHLIFSSYRLNSKFYWFSGVIVIPFSNYVQLYSECHKTKNKIVHHELYSWLIT